MDPKSESTAKHQELVLRQPRALVQVRSLGADCGLYAPVTRYAACWEVPGWMDSILYIVGGVSAGENETRPSARETTMHSTSVSSAGRHVLV